MAIRTDVDVNFLLSPRIVTVRAPSVEISIQDLYDTLRSIEEQMPNLEDDRLIDGAGKESLGSGVLVGITASLNNAQLSFEARKVELTSGTVTTGDANGITLNDTGATFISDGVSRGDIVFNYTDQSIANVLTVVSENQLITDGLTTGADNQFDVSDSYEIFDVVQCNISGGNLVAVDDVGADLDPVFPTFGTQVVRTSSSSATLQELADIQFASFEGAVTVDVINGVSGTDFPNGTGRAPVNNIADALTIASNRGLFRISVIGDITLSSGDLSEFEIRGQSIARSVITVTSGATVTGTEFFDAEVTGTLNNSSRFSNCLVRDVSIAQATLTDCIISGTITLLGAGITFMVNCKDAESGNATPIIDFNNTAHEINVRGYSGGLTLRNKGQSDTVVIDLVTGRVVLESSVTAGSIIVRGIGSLEDSSGGTAAINDLNLIRNTGGGQGSMLIG